MDEKKSFLLFTDLREPMQFLSDEDCGRLFRAILNYADLGEVPDFSGALGMAFSFVRATLDRNEIKWQETRAKRAAAGRAGGLASGVSRARSASFVPSHDLDDVL